MAVQDLIDSEIDHGECSIDGGVSLRHDFGHR